MTADGLVLIDTSVWVSALRPSGAGNARDQVGRLLDEDRAATCGVIIAELLNGTGSRKEYHALSTDLDALHYLPAPESVWKRISELGFKLRAKGLHIPTTDLLIAQIATDNKCTLLHTDIHFDHIARHSSLKAQTIR